MMKMREAKVFEKCPEYQSEHFRLRRMDMQDAEGLFQCYSNPEAVKYFNGDCCDDDFYYTDFGQFVKCNKQVTIFDEFYSGGISKKSLHAMC